MWLKHFRNNVFLFFALVLFAANSSRAQEIIQGQVSLDPITQKSLEDIRSKLNSGNAEGLALELKRVINSSGYIKPLAEIYYKMAQTETDGNLVIGYYSTVIQYWPDSTWAQRAVIEFVPLFLMSGGQIGADVAPVVWKNLNSLLALAPDAARMGEDGEALKHQTLLNLLYLANSMRNVGQISSLTRYEVPEPSEIQEKMGIAQALALIHTNQIEKATAYLQDWITEHPDSDLLPTAYLTLYITLSEPTLKQQILEFVQTRYADTLEAALIKKQ
jgi:hypothetical protein